jgi:hypothetical protein
MVTSTNTKSDSKAVCKESTHTQTGSKSETVSQNYSDLQNCSHETDNESSDSEGSRVSPPHTNGKSMPFPSQMVLRSRKSLVKYQELSLSDSGESDSILKGLPMSNPSSEIFTTENDKLDEGHIFPHKSNLKASVPTDKQKVRNKEKKIKGQKLEQCVSKAYMLRSCRDTEDGESFDLRAKGEGSSSSDLRAKVEDPSHALPSTSAASQPYYDPGPSTSQQGRKRSRKLKVPHKKVKK